MDPVSESAPVPAGHSRIPHPGHDGHSTLAWVTVAALGLNALVGTVAIGSSLARIVLLDHVLRGDVVSLAQASRDEWRESLVGIASVGAWIVCAVLFLSWLHRAYRDAVAQGVTGLRSTPGNAVVSFFVPLVNLFRPYQVVRELHDALDPASLPPAVPRPRPEGAEHYRASAAVPSSIAGPLPEAPMGVWWACWVASNMVSGVGLRALGGTDALALRTQSWVALTGDALAVAAAVTGALVVRALDARARARRHQLAVG